jgi:hypothetical protein
MSDPLDTYEQWTGEKHVYDDKVVKGNFADVQPLGQARHDLQRLVDEIKQTIYAYTGSISVTEAIGALELAKLEIYQEQS